ncbi:MAG: hypothetical protein KAT00_09045 [Planctomycetes bacterium]|nr:hypothetical protein [Planctomycetota bacterium]
MKELLSRTARRARKRQAAMAANARFEERGNTKVRASVKGDKLIVELLRPEKPESN